MAIVTDSEFCFNGLTKHILLWERRDWLGISHSDQWVQIVELTRDSSRQYKFFWVPSHVSIEGNEGADRQAEEGRLLHEYNLRPLPKRQLLNPLELTESEETRRGGREMTPLPPATSWLLSEASFVSEDEEQGTPEARGESPHDWSVITISEDEEGGGGGVRALVGLRARIPSTCICGVADPMSGTEPQAAQGGRMRRCNTTDNDEMSA